MDTLEDLEVVFKLQDQLASIAVHVRLLCNGSLVRGEALLGDAVVRKDSPVLTYLSTRPQECNQSLANANVIGGGVVVKFLMPLLIEMASSLRNLVPVHDVQDLVSDFLTTIASSPQSGQGPPAPQANVGMLLPDSADLSSQTVCRPCELSWLGVVIALPIQEAHEGGPLPDEDPTPELQVVQLVVLCCNGSRQRERWHPVEGVTPPEAVCFHHGIPGPQPSHGGLTSRGLRLPLLHEALAEVVAVHQGHVAPLDLGADDLVGYILPGALPGSSCHRLIEEDHCVLAICTLDPLVSLFNPEHKAHADDARNDGSLRGLLCSCRDIEGETVQVVLHWLERSLTSLSIKELSALRQDVFRRACPAFASEVCEGAPVQQRTRRGSDLWIEAGQDFYFKAITLLAATNIEAAGLIRQIDTLEGHSALLLSVTSALLEAGQGVLIVGSRLVDLPESLQSSSFLLRFGFCLGSFNSRILWDLDGEVLSAIFHPA
mmetsp:Transcript_78600/g.163343  ORF Transcript_78600/g.163343 Transcript_78600/m.163343 type:complete len:488 (+) Transcript_78600:2347-3810(+)